MASSGRSADAGVGHICARAHLRPRSGRCGCRWPPSNPREASSASWAPPMPSPRADHRRWRRRVVAEIVPYASARLSAAARAVPPAPHARLARVADHRSPGRGPEADQRARRPRRRGAAPPSAGWAQSPRPPARGPGTPHARPATASDARARCRPPRPLGRRELRVRAVSRSLERKTTEVARSPPAKPHRRPVSRAEEEESSPSTAAARPRSSPSPSHPSTAPPLTRAPSPPLRSPTEGACRLRDRDRRRRRPRSAELTKAQSFGPRPRTALHTDATTI